MASVKDALATMARNLKGTSGKSLTEWAVLSRKSGCSKHGEIVKWLKEKHGLGHGYANLVAKESLKTDEGGDDDLLAAQYAGPKAALRPLYDQLVETLKSLGSDVEIAPKKNNVSIRRKKQFALLQPSTASRMDIGLILKDTAPKGRLEASGSFNAMFTHRVRIADASEINAELKRWFKAAYDLA